ncbi:iron-containing redox enzyme family protein [Saccharopolyspora erythraea]|uniref:iron-containing redox enzyme family protein n=1 Tax=Saccharopolyspora erythraea TaxID=1836 RepID=UPI001BA4F13B|nr:iron-containing redox enzyme family protein [Saccharopolyspora erythraea]QUH02457.1 iron-containing redox enzyme family protein [Saccharopolyspora erythraea]
MRTTAAFDDQAVGAALPAPRGPVSAAILDALANPPPPGPLPLAEAERAAPYGEDLALALHVCYELHYRGFRVVSPDWEWDPDLLRLRGALERTFLSALRADVEGGDDVEGTLEALLVEPTGGTVSHYLRDHGKWWQLREFFAHRSIYHLKEADPHVWVVPRLQGQAKAALVAVEFDEFGGGRGERMHARLFADLLAGAGMSGDYLHYLDAVPAPQISIVNLMSLLGLHRGLRGALVGHFSAAEITTAPNADRMARALRRLGADPACTHFFTEHVEADAVHEQIMRRDVVGDLLAREPALRADVVFGVQATDLLEDALARHLFDCWRDDRTSLREPLPDDVRDVREG